MNGEISVCHWGALARSAGPKRDEEWHLRFQKHAALDTKGIIRDAEGLVKPFGIKDDAFGIMQRSQLRAARALLSWSQERLAAASGVSLPTIKRLEPGDGPLATRVETQEKIKRALEDAGVLFTSTADGSHGVQLPVRR